MPVTLSPSNSDTRQFKVAAVQAEPLVSFLLHTIFLSTCLYLPGFGLTFKEVSRKPFVSSAKPPPKVPRSSGSQRFSSQVDQLLKISDSLTDDITGYPWTPWSNTFVEAAPVLKEYQANAMALHSPEMERICQAVAENEVNVVLGFAERGKTPNLNHVLKVWLTLEDGSTLYIAQVTITQDGKIANHRRKIKVSHIVNALFK